MLFEDLAVHGCVRIGLPPARRPPASGRIPRRRMESSRPLNRMQSSRPLKWN